MKTSVKTTVLSGIPNAILMGVNGYYVWNIIIFQMIYIQFICKYLKFKIEELDGKLDALSMISPRKQRLRLTFQKNWCNSQIIWFIVLWDQWIQHYFPLKVLFNFLAYLWFGDCYLPLHHFILAFDISDQVVIQLFCPDAYPHILVHYTDRLFGQ